MALYDMQISVPQVSRPVWMKLLMIQIGRKQCKKKLRRFIRMGTWHLVPLAKGANIIDYRWVFKIKRKADGSIERYKGRLVAKGYK
jgi:hypothetical protein